MRFCPHCGVAAQAGARFCVECGRPLGGIDEPSAAGPWLPVTPAFIAVFASIALLGVGIAALVMRARSGHELAAADSAPVAGNRLPPGHPKIELPAEARKFIDDLRQQAEQRPADLAVWNRLGEVSMRAGFLDSSYFAGALRAYGHVLKIDPDNLEALRGAGNVNYEGDNYDQAIAAYEHYLRQRPEDPQVRTDLGTMYLYTGNADQAVVQYKKALSYRPDFFNAYFNLGVAYDNQGKVADARQAFNKALQLAPDERTKQQVNQRLAKLGGAQQSAAGPSPATPMASGGTFRSTIEQMVRGLPVAGPKVKSIEWSSNSRAKVLLDNFPMDQMPPFAKQKFLTDLKTGIERAKASHKIDAPTEIDLVDAPSGRVMDSVTQ